MRLANIPLLLAIGGLALMLLNHSFLHKFTINDDCRAKQSTTHMPGELSNSTHHVTTAEFTDDHSSANLAIVTAFSENHKLEAVAMLRSLIAVQFQGPIYIFLMKEVGKDNNKWIDEFKEELLKSPLMLRMIDFEVQNSALTIDTYCFKPTAMSVFLRRNGALPYNEAAQVVMWSDASTRYLQNPSIWAKYMIQHNIDFVGRQAPWSIPQQTHRGTFDYFHFNPDEFNDHPAIAATHFLVNLQRDQIRQRVLHRWIDCGVLDCRTCMAPIGSSKKDPNGTAYKEGANEYVSHRQDQSVLTLLVTDYMKKQGAEANVKIVQGGEGGGKEGEAPYFCLRTRRFRGDIQSVADWNTTITIPSHACETLKGTILNISSNGTIAWIKEE